MAQTSGLPESVAPDSPLEAAFVEHLEIICASSAFENSTTLKNLLRYLFYNKDRQISEYSLAVEALNRRADFDPQVDATVRVQISRLRRRLKDFYLAEGRALPIRFFVPLGTHQLVLEGEHNDSGRVSQTPNAMEAVPVVLPRLLSAEPKKKTLPWRVLVLACLVAILSAICAWQFWKIRSQAQALARQTTPAQLLPFWQEFGANGKPMQIVIPNPTFFAWYGGKNSTLMMRDTSVNNYMNIGNSPELSMLEKQLGKPQLSQYYAVSSDVIASLRLLHYMDDGNLKADITISSNAAAGLFEGENVILVGTPGTLTPFKNQLDRLYFKFDPQGWMIQNPQPRAGEMREYHYVSESALRNIFPGLIAVLPGISKGSNVLILAGQRTAALVSYLTSMEGNQQLMEARRKAGGGPFFEAVILSETEGDTVLNNRLMAVRSYPASSSYN